MARPLLSLGLAVGLTAGLLAVVTAETNSAVSALRYEDNLIESGYATLFVEAGQQTGTTLTSDDCTALGLLAGVRAAVAVGPQLTFHLWNSTGPTVPVRFVSGDVADFLAVAVPERMSRWRNAQVFVDVQSTAASNSTSGESLIALFDGTSVATARAISVPLTSIGAGAAGNAFIATATEMTVDSCALLVENDQRSQVAASAGIALPPAQGFSQRWALNGADLLDTPRARFEGRASQLLWLACVGVFMGLAALTLRIRRSDSALYAVLGLSPAAITVMAAIELLLAIGVGTILAAVVLAGAVLRTHLPVTFSEVGIRSGIRAIVAVTLSTTALCWYSSRRTTGSTLDAIKDR